MNKQKFIGVKVLEDAQPMTLAAAKEEGIVSPVADAESDGYRVEYEGGHVSWSPKSVFEKAYAALTTTDEKMLEKVDSPVAEIKNVLKVKAHVAKIESKDWSLKKLGSEVLKVYKVDLNKINNDN